MNAALLYRKKYQTLYATFGGTVDLYRNPSASGGTVAAAAQYGTAVPMLLIPATDTASLGVPPPGLGGGRAGYVGVFRDDAPAVRPGDEVRQGGKAYQLESVADWTLGVVVGLSLPI